MIRFVLCIAVSSFFSSCSYTNNWQCSSNSQVAQGEFKDLTGEQVFALRVPSNDTYLSYEFKETTGDLEASIKSASKRVFSKKIESSEASSVHLMNQKGTEYQVILKGNHASGSFDARFVSSGK